MCRIEERLYHGPDGSSQLVQVPYHCRNARHGNFCSNVTTIEYCSQPPSVTRDDAPSPASYNPPTPTGTGTYLVEKRKPSGIHRRPSTRDGTTRAIKPEIIISIGSKKDKNKVYIPGHRKRASLGANSVASSNEVHIDSPGSDASYTVYTGYPDAPLPPPNGFSQSPGYTTITAAPKSHHRHSSSASSYTTSSKAPSLSEPDSPSTRRAPRYPPTIVHNPPVVAASGFPPSSPTVTRASPSSSPSYRVAAPQEPSQPGVVATPDNLFPTDYAEFHDHSGSSNGSFTRAVEITDRDRDRARQRKLKTDAEKKKRQEEADEILARELQEKEQKRLSQEEKLNRSIKEQEQKRALQEEELKRSFQQEQEHKQVRFELDRADFRAKERAENQFAEMEKRRAEDREEYRQKQKEQREREERQREREERAAKETRKEKPKERNRMEEEKARRKKQSEDRDTRPPTRDTTTKRHSTQSRRNSVSQESQKERERLLMETQAQMAREREAAEQREREERAAFLRQQQETSQSYWSPRRDDRYQVANENPGVGRRNSVSGRRNSISTNAPPMGLGRSNSRRVSIHQSAPPPITTTFQQTYATRPPSSHHQQTSTPLFSPPSAGPSLPSARLPSYSSENPFAPQPSARHSPPMPPRDPWDARDVREALPREAAPTHQRQVSDDRHPTLRRRGEEVINRAAAADERARQAKLATHKLGKVVGYENDYAVDDSEDEEDRLAGYGPRLGMGKHGHGHSRRKN